jgi:hypothetical protein
LWLGISYLFFHHSCILNTIACATQKENIQGD